MFLFIWFFTATFSPSQVWCQGLIELGSMSLPRPGGSTKNTSEEEKRSAKDFVISYEGADISLKSLIRGLRRMGIQAPIEADFLDSVQEIKGKLSSCCLGRCGLRQRNESLLPLCFCDVLCNHFGDCCYDFHSSCPGVNAHNGGFRDLGPQTCENVKQANRTWYGKAMISTCPAPRPINKADTESSCFSKHRTLNVQREVPVIDARSSITYRSVTCASCNNIIHTDFVPWVLTAHCSIPNTTTEKVVEWLKSHPCKRNYEPPPGRRNDVTCILKMSYSYAPWQRGGNLSVICDLCNSYAMVFMFNKSYHRNPHCVLCDPEGKDSIVDMSGSDFFPPGPTLTIFFNFKLKTYENAMLPESSIQRSNTNKSRSANTPGLDAAERVITAVCCCVSIIALLVLIVVYSLLKELRNLPGKVLMNLACAIICYQALLLSAGQTGITAVCVAISVLLHYFVVASFTWMAVMGYDLAKKFTSKGVHVKQDTTKTLVIYCGIAWGGPLILVAVCFTLDVTTTAYFGYGIGDFCWIHNGFAALFSLGVPVALALLFNIIALVRTLIAIHQAKKATQRVATQSAQPSLAFLCIKLTMVLGVPWVLGYVADYAQILKYIYIILNALQGLFVSLVFLTNKRVFNLMRRKACRNVNSVAGTAHKEIWPQGYTTRTHDHGHQETKSPVHNGGDEVIEISVNSPRKSVKGTEVEMTKKEELVTTEM